MKTEHSHRIAHEHTPEAISRRLEHAPRESALRDWTYGGIDGAVTTFAVVSGVVGAGLPTRTILILGLANVVADGFSMAASNYMGTRAEADEANFLEVYERRQVQLDPAGEREEVRQILRKKGFGGVALEHAVELFTSDRERWVRMMLTEEYGLPATTRSPWRAAMNTFVAFMICGMIPLIPFVISLGVSSEAAFRLSAALTFLTFFGIGSLKSRWALTPWWKAGSTTALVGSAAATLAYAVGVFFHA